MRLVDKGVLRLERSEDRFIDLIVRAFRDEPYYAWLFRQDARRDATLHRYFAAYLQEIGRKGAEFYVSEEWDACGVMGASVEADHHFSAAALARLVPAVIAACSPWRVHRMLAMESAIGKGHAGMQHMRHGLFIGTVGNRPRASARLLAFARRNFPSFVMETADERVAALFRRQGFVETGRAKPGFGGPEVIFLLHRRKE